MKCRKIICSMIAALALPALFAVEVDEREVQSAGGIDTVVFRNYVGPQTVINTDQEIRQIGAGLGNSISNSVESSATVGNPARYQIIHCVDPAEKGKLDADILVIGANATVDHIDNVRRILSGYLMAAYGYARRDADTIATFVTVYNAVYRGKLDIFQTKYKKVVSDNLTAEKCGMDLNYENWPGKSQIVIPLADINGGLSTVDTSVISDRQVVKSMQEDEDKNIDTRKDMVAIKEREADSAEAKAQEAQKAATKENEKLAQEQKKQAQADAQAQAARKDANAAQKNAANQEKNAANQQKKADTAQKNADSAKAKAESNPNDQKAQQKAQDSQKAADEAQKKADEAQKAADEAKKDAEAKDSEADQKEAEAAEQQKKTDEQAAKANEASSTATEAQNKADTKRSEAQEERSEIAKDQQELARQEEKNENAPYVVGLKNVDDLGVLSELVKVNANDGSIIKESPVSVIRSRTIYEDNGKYIAIAGVAAGNGTVKLVQLDSDKMEIVKESSETVAETSVLVKDGSSYYCVVKSGSDYVLAKFDGELNNQLKSPVAVKAATPVTVTSKGILVTAANGKPALLKTDDLSQIQ